MTPPLVARSPIESSVMVVTVSRLVPFSVTIEPVPVATTPGESAPFVDTEPAPRVTAPPPSACTPAAVAPFVVIVATPPIVIVDGVLDSESTPEA